jgi:hypothetical protein
MSEKIDGGNSGDSTDEKSKGEVSGKNKKRRIFARGYFANDDIGIVLLCLVVLFGGAIIPSSNHAKLVCVGLCFLSCVALVIHGYINRHIPTDEEIDEKFRRETDESLDKIESKLKSLDSRISQSEGKVDQLGPRHLTHIQHYALKDAMSAFRGQKAFITPPSFDTEAGRYGMYLRAALVDAGWEIPESALRSESFVPNFDNIMVAHNQKDSSEITKNTAHALAAAIIKMGIQVHPNVISREQLKPDEIEIMIGAKPHL